MGYIPNSAIHRLRGTLPSRDSCSSVWLPLDQEVWLFLSDNAVVAAIHCARSSEIPVLIYLLRELLLSEPRFGFAFSACHALGLRNKIADVISRFR